MRRAAAVVAAMGLIAGCDSDLGLDLSPYVVDTRDADGATTGALVVHGDFNNGWSAATEVSPGVFSFVPTLEAVSYGRVCPPDASTPWVTVDLWYEVLTGRRELALRCERPAPAQAVPVTVIPAASTVTARTSRSLVGDAGGHILREAPGPSDLVATSDGRVLIQRGVLLPPAAPLILDVDRDGSDLVPISLAVPTTTSDEVVEARYAFLTAGGTRASMAGDVDGDVEVVLHTVPRSQVMVGDLHEIEVLARVGDGGRFVVMQIDELVPDQPLLPFTAPYIYVDIAWNDLVFVQWLGRPDGDTQLAIEIEQRGEQPRSWTATFSAPRLEYDASDVDGGWSPPDLSPVAGWDLAWNVTVYDLAYSSWRFEDLTRGAHWRHGNRWSRSFAASPEEPPLPRPPRPAAER